MTQIDHENAKLIAAVGFFYNPESDEVFIHLRDGNTTHDPNVWSCFGGGIENGETPEECCVREWKEELGITVDISDLHFLMHYTTRRGTRHAVFFTYATFKKSDVTLTEGADCMWVKFADAFTLPLSNELKSALKHFRERQGSV